MNHRKAVRYQGKITTWKDGQGFGFIAPNGGGPPVFVHIKSFASGSPRPAENTVVTYELAVNEKGQPRADNAAIVGTKGLGRPSPQAGEKGLIAAFGFVLAIALLAYLEKIPAVILGIYTGMSVFTFIVYGVDKSAAQNNRWRTKESTLHLLGLAGGWPGALAAQQIFRHKSKKETFRTMFWFTVTLNFAALAWTLSNFGAGMY